MFESRKRHQFLLAALLLHTIITFNLSSAFYQIAACSGFMHEQQGAEFGMRHFPRSIMALIAGFLLVLGLIGAAAAPTGNAASAAAGTRNAEPADFGFPLPNPEPTLPFEIDRFAPPAFAAGAGAPAIAEISRTAGPDEIISMTGVGLDKQTGFGIFAQAPTAIEGNLSSSKPLRADASAATLLLPASLPAWSMYLVWPERDGARGRPFAVNRTEAWWLGPNNTTAGTAISLYGRNLAHMNGTSTAFIYIKPANAPGLFVAPISVNPFRVEFKVPDLVAGSYEVWAHNGHGGRFGWSGPLPLQVLGKSPWAGQEARILDVKSFGATGNGTSDDTSAINEALEAAAASAPATVHLPAGTYRVSSALSAPDNVRWLGDGLDQTVIRLDADTGASMIDQAERNVQFERLTFDANGNTGSKPLMNLGAVSNLRLQSVRLIAWNIPALETDRSSGIYIDGSELIENGSFYGSSNQLFMTNNRFRMTGYGESVVALWGGRDFSMIGNDLANADETRDDGHGIGRFFVAQGHFGNLRNMYWEGNRSHNAAPHDCDTVDCNKGEQICFEMVGSELKDGLIGATPTSVTLAGLAAPDERSGRDLVIVGGAGAGQRRHIVNVKANTAMLDRPWNVVPDRSSRFAFAATASQIAIYKNSFEGRASYAEHDSDSTAVLLYGNVYDAVVDSNRISQMRHAMMTVALTSTSGLSPYFLQYSNNTISDSNSGLYVGTTFTDAGTAGVWGGLGNIYRNNTFDRLAHIGVEYESWSYEGADYNGTVFEKNRFTNLPFGFIDGFRLMWTYNGNFKEAPPRSSRKYNTILYRNSFDRGSAPLQRSVGFKSLQPANTWLNIDSTWTGFAAGNSGPSQ
ncbi:glycosyl hydrolase family 28-related protein [Phyllobacterium sp. UNC302MFCol5.2]|uniref:right-handed parallel beta-helix repeat-containing protein n=1 Tax=Phyllobacterium sp. UNC302MFCol5.2 TaxID=1449065 RepID=UPI000AB72A40|nr:glycosyl hydrolase family 28-related protein [Phyllobacterium sp. UNC302MFCol5.2]